ncbi:MAG: hypothetical protein R3240_00195 [Gammaproteobacteria bacterium]|nr:hypothetical protein [Gammaproteobacteria bacterium]
MLQRYKTPLIALIALSVITLFSVVYFSPELNNLGIEIKHINHFN